VTRRDNKKEVPMKRPLLIALTLTGLVLAPCDITAAPANVAAVTGRWEAVPLPDKVEDPPLALAWSRSNPLVVYGRGRRALWRSDDGGRSWTATGFMGDEESPWWEAPARRHWGSPPNWGRAMGVDAGDPRTVYVRSTTLAAQPVGAYEPIPEELECIWSRVRSAAYVSRDGGDTWHDLNCLHVAPDPVRPGRVYGVTADLRLQLSDDHGGTWRDLGLGHPQLINGLHVYASPADPDRILIGQHPSAVWCSTDGGATWADAKLGRAFSQYTVDERVASRLYGVLQNSLYAGDDAGDWRRLHDFGVDPASRCARIVPHPGEGRLAAVSDARFWTSNDGGETWQAHDAPSGITDLAVDPADPDRLLLSAAAESRGHLFESRDGGSSWSPMPPPELPAAVATVTAGPGGRLWAGSATEPDEDSRLPVLYVRDGGVWQRRGSTPRLRGWWGPVRSLFIHPQDSDAMLADFGLVLRSEDGGHSWQQTRAGRDLYARGPSPFHTRPHRPATIYFQGEGLLRSDDAGATWQRQGGDWDVVGFEPSLAEPGVVVQATDRELRRVDDEGSVQGASTVPDGGYLVALSRHPLSPQQLIVAAVVDNGVAVYSVEDDGLRWQQLGGFEGTLPVTYPTAEQPAARHDNLSRWRSRSHGIARLRFHPTDSEVFYLVFRRDLLVTRDGGQTWQRIEDLPHSVPWYNDVAVDPEASDDLYVATPHGLYRLRGAIHTAIREAREARPDAFVLDPAYPNPFNGETTIGFTLLAGREVDLAVYNVAGQRLATLARGWQEAGTHALTWNGLDAQGRTQASGVYLCSLVAGDGMRQTRRILLLR